MQMLKNPSKKLLDPDPEAAWWLPKFNQFFPVHRYICVKIFMKIRSVVLRKAANRETDRQTDRQTDKRPVLHVNNLIGEVNSNSNVCSGPMWLWWRICLTSCLAPFPRQRIIDPIIALDTGGGTSFNALVGGGESLNSGLQNLASTN